MLYFIYEQDEQKDIDELFNKGLTQKEIDSLTQKGFTKEEMIQSHQYNNKEINKGSNFIASTSNTINIPFV